MKFPILRFSASAITLAAALFAPGSSIAELPAHNVPRAVSIAKDLGRVNPSTEVNLTVVLQPRNAVAYHQAVQALYQPGSPTYHKWFTDADFEKYAPTQADFEAVKQELINHGFTVVSSDPHRFSVRVHGTSANAESAFQTEIHSFDLNGRKFSAQTSDAHLTGPAEALISAVSGLERHQSTPQLTIAKNFQTNQPKLKVAITKSTSDASLLSNITGTPLSISQTFDYTTSGAALPTATYTGTVYDANPNLTVAYSPQELQAHYGLTNLIQGGLNGSGQTIALVEAYGYAAAEADAEAAAKLWGLPSVNASNFSVIYPEGKPLNPNAADLTGWTGEIALDIQSAHAIAPGAKIVVVASSGQDNEDQINSLNYIINNHVAYVASSSWENDDEIIAGSDEEEAFNSVLEKGAAIGISFQFSSGDGGDLGLGTSVGSVGVPSNSPYAVAVGGTSILNNPYGTGDVVAGWGNDISYIDDGGPVDPPNFDEFYAGAGGGQSQYWSKPFWQASLPGNWRQVPDVSALADPFTGFAIIYTDAGTQYFEAGIGGTSLASPIFTSIWALAEQYNGWPLGLASPLVAQLNPKKGQITDVQPTSPLNKYDPTGSVTDSNGTTSYTTRELYPNILYTQTQFPAAIWQLNSVVAVAISFGTDSALTVTPGWDNVTGWGEPNGLPFFKAVAFNGGAADARTTSSVSKTDLDRFDQQ